MQRPLGGFGKVADQGFDKAQYELGMMYYFGAGVPKNWTEAYAWINVASTNGSMGADLLKVLEKRCLSLPYLKVRSGQK
jgi:uncharacterized protein